MRNASQAVTTRDAILDATDRLLARDGYRKMTIDDLAHEVGIGKGSVYLHFTSKEEIVLTNVDRIIERLKVRLHEIAAGDGAIDRKLVDMLCERVMFRFESVQHYSQSLNELLSNVRQNLLKRRERYFLEEARILASAIEAGQSSGIFADGDALDLAKCLVTATNALLPYSLSVFELGERTEIRRRTRLVAELLIRGLKH